MDVLKIIAAAQDEVANRPITFEQSSNELKSAFNILHEQSNGAFQARIIWPNHSIMGTSFLLKCPSLFKIDATLYLMTDGRVDIVDHSTSKSSVFYSVEDFSTSLIRAMANQSLFKSQPSAQLAHE